LEKGKYNGEIPRERPEDLIGAEQKKKVFKREVEGKTVRPGSIITGRKEGENNRPFWLKGIP